MKKPKVNWCDSCIGCEKDNPKRYYYCSTYVPIIRNQLNFIDNIIKKWEDKRRCKQ